MSKYDELKRLAVEADMPWFEEGDSPYSFFSKEDADFICAASPQVVFELITEVERLTAGQAEKCRSLKKLQADIDQKVLSHLRSVPGSTAWAMRGAINATREDVSKACQRLKRKGLVVCDGAYWKEAAK